MKPIFSSIFILLFLTFTRLSAQYLPVISADTVSFVGIQEVIDNFIDMSIIIQGDTVFDNKTYNKVWHRTEYDDYATLVGFLRQNASNSKLYFYSIFDQEELLVMDLDVNLGDVVEYYKIRYSLSEPLAPTTASVSAIYQLNGRKVVTLNGMNQSSFFSDSLRFVEGFGCTSSVLFQSNLLPVDWSGYGYRVCQKYENGALAYTYGSANHCNPNMGGISTTNIDVSEVMELCPNPTQHNINVRLKHEKNSIREIKLYDVVGQIVFESKFSTPIQVIELPTSTWIDGLYFMELHTNLGTFVRTFLKN